MEVYLNDVNMNWDEATVYFDDAHEWAVDNCASYRGFYVQDVSDVSYVWDRIAEYIFDNEVDVVAFTLRWK